MRVLAIVHEDHAGPGVFGEAIRERGDTLTEWMVPTATDLLATHSVTTRCWC
jgi:hypothetical protein